MEQFANDIGRPKDLNLVFISERQKVTCSCLLLAYDFILNAYLLTCLLSCNTQGLIPAMETLFPIVEHRYYVKHTYNNFKVKHKGMQLKSVLWRCAGTTLVTEFKRGMQYLKSMGLDRNPRQDGVAAIFVNREKPENYTYPCYYKDTYVETYKTPIPPMPGQSEWISSGQPTLVAPIIYKPPGKPPIKRKRDANEPRNPYKAFRANKPVKCGSCQKEWHNVKGCKANVTNETP